MDDDIELLQEDVSPRDAVIDVARLLPSPVDKFPEGEVSLYLERRANGWGELEAGIAAPISWTPLKIKQFLACEGVKDLIWALEERDHEAMERAIYLTGLKGNPASQKFYAVNKMGHRGWADRRSVRVEGEVDHNLVLSMKQALDEQTRELVAHNSAEGIAALQEAIGLGDDPDEDIIDAEVVD